MKREKYVIVFILLGFIVGAFALYGANPQHTHKSLIVKERDHDDLFGLIISDVSPWKLKKYHLKGGAEIVKVVKNSDAERAGLKKGDIILKFDGSAVEDPHDLVRLMRFIDEEKDVDIVVNREGKELIFTAHIKPYRDDDQDRDEEEFYGPEALEHLRGMMDSLRTFPFKMMPYMAEIGSKGGYLGVEVEDLTDQLLKYFKADYGVLVKRVEKDSPAEKSGIRAGDVIYKINDKKIEDTADLIRTVRYYDPGDKVDVYLIRNGKKKTVAVELGKFKDDAKWHRNFPRFMPGPEPWKMRNFRGRILPPGENGPNRFERERHIYKF